MQGYLHYGRQLPVVLCTFLSVSLFVTVVTVFRALVHSQTGQKGHATADKSEHWKLLASYIILSKVPLCIIRQILTRLFAYMLDTASL